MKRSIFWLVVCCILLSILSLGQSNSGGAVSAICRNGVLHVSIPYAGLRSGAGRLTVEVLDPEDHVIGRLERNITLTAREGLRDQPVLLPQNLGVEDLVWHRLRFSFTFQGEQTPTLQGIRAISQILQRPLVRVLGQQSYLSGGPAAVRVIVTEAGGDTPVTTGNLRIELQGGERKPEVLLRSQLNSRGTTRAQFQFPTGTSGERQLRYIVETPLGDAEYLQTVRLETKAAILLTTEKPVYQPGQLIHARALALGRASHEAFANHKLTFEVEDSRGNKVFREITRTDSYGIASAAFELAEEVNTGTYHLRAVLDDPSQETTPVRSEIALQVERYVLPRFKVDVDLSAKAAKTRRGYRPGEHVTGVIRSNYFFGKPVDHAHINVKATTLDVTLADAASVEGQTTADGSFAFDLRLPDFLAGKTKGAAQVLIEATVKDGAGHIETRGEPITVSDSPLLITAVPENGVLIPGLENQIFLLASYPDGTPAQADLVFHGAGITDQHVRTDASGIAIVTAHEYTQQPRFRVEASDHEGNHASDQLDLKAEAGPEPILLHTERALYLAGEQVRMQVRTGRQRGSAYVDMIKDGQTIGTYDLDIIDGKAALDVPATAAMAGTVEFNAYVFGHDGSPRNAHRMIFVRPADDLRIKTVMDAATYKPGTEAKVSFHVTNRQGQGVQAALGVEVVDQAVFALAEKQPGFAKVFFYLEQELMKPRYEIHSIGMPAVISSNDPSLLERDLAARALFSATESVQNNSVSISFGTDQETRKANAYTERYYKQLMTTASPLANAIRKPVEFSSCQQSGMEKRVQGIHIQDPWGTPVRVSYRSWDARYAELRSAGPDGKFQTADDIVGVLDDPWCDRSSSPVRAVITFEPLDGPGEVTGLVTDATEAPVGHAPIRLVEFTTGQVHLLTSGGDGRFRFAGLKPGRFRLEVNTQGFRLSRVDFDLPAGKRAVAAAVLQIGYVSQSIAVEAGARAMVAMSMDASMANGAAMVPRIRAYKDGPKAPASGIPAAVEPHVRTWFPESLFVRPEIITDRDGRASITIPIADNITTWRMALLASTKHGALGSGASSIKVFQDFFTELDLPVTLTQGDEVSLPVAVYNYSGVNGSVQVQLEPADWYTLEGDPSSKTIVSTSGRVEGTQFRIAAKRIGKFKLTLRATMNGAQRYQDIVIREIEVIPNGKEESLVFNGQLQRAVKHTVSFPASAIPDARTVFVRLYPGPMSQLVEGMDSLLQMPHGCFEQTSSSTYPNVLALDYMKRTKKVTPEISAKASGFIGMGYQRLVTFEVPGGGFSWFGTSPANKILTAYGLMEFQDMSKVHDIDPAVISRTQQWLASQQRPDGSWNPDGNGIQEGATNRFQSDILRITAYVAWSLRVSQYQGPAIEHARQYLSQHLDEKLTRDPYTLAILANFAVDYGKDPSLTDRIFRLLLEARSSEGDTAFWTSEQTGMYGTGVSASVETRALAVQALIKRGAEPALTTKAMNYIISKKGASGTWGTTQATIMALRALVLSAGSVSGSARGKAEILLNGRTAATLTLTPENNDLFHQFVFKGADALASNDVELRFTGEGTPAYQVAGRYFVPWTVQPSREQLSIQVTYDRTRLAQNEVVTATANIRNLMAQTANMVMVDLGIPPGFELLSEDLVDLKRATANKHGGRLDKFSVTPTQAILYFDAIKPGSPVHVTFRLRAKYPIRTQTFASRVYEYYDPAVSSTARPAVLEVIRR